MKFEIEQNYWNDDAFFSFDSIEINNPVTYLVGCSGSGKSALMEKIKDECEKNETLF